MTISARNRKLLWSRSGNECAFPGCGQELTPLAEDGSDLVVGVEAHIVAQRPGGPRGNARAQPDELDSYRNLIILCPTHHTIVDQHSAAFSSTVLTEMKANHERSVRERDTWAPTGDLSEFDLSGISGISTAWRCGDFAVAACFYGSFPSQTSSGHWTGSGIRFVQAAPAREPHELFNSSEFDPDIEYWMSGNVLHVVQATFLYDDGDLAPLIEHQFDVTTFPATHRTVQLLFTPSSISSTVEELMAELRTLDLPNQDDRENVILGALFKIGLSNPVTVLAVFSEILEICFPGGERTCGLSMQRELELIAEHRTSAV